MAVHEFVQQLGLLVLKAEVVNEMVDMGQVQVLGQGSQGKAVRVVLDG